MIFSRRGVLSGRQYLYSYKALNAGVLRQKQVHDNRNKFTKSCDGNIVKILLIFHELAEESSTNMYLVLLKMAKN